MVKRLATAFLALAVAALAGCQKPAEGVQIVYIPKSTGNPYFGRIIEGFQAGCRPPACSFTTVGPATSDATSQLPILNAQIQRKVDVIAITPNSSDALNRAFDRARKAGIKVVMVNSDITGFEGRRDAAVTPVDFDRVGASQVALMSELMGGKGKFAILSATTDAPDQNRFIFGMKKALADDPRFKGLELVRVAYGDDEPQKSTIETQALLSSVPGLKAILAPTAVGLASAAQAVAAAGKSDQVVVTGLGTPDQLRRYVEAGQVKAFQLWDPYEQGLAAARLGVAMAKEGFEPAPGKTLDVPGLGVLTFHDLNVLRPREDLITFTRDNIARYRF